VPVGGWLPLGAAAAVVAEVVEVPAVGLAVHPAIVSDAASSMIAAPAPYFLRRVDSFGSLFIVASRLERACVVPILGRSVAEVVTPEV
jgi:hypothetical protein